VTVSHIGIGACEVGFELLLNGKVVAYRSIGSEATTLTTVRGGLELEPVIDPPGEQTNALTAKVRNNGYCSEDSVIDFARFRVVSLG
jgi:hypothetical protein